MYWFLTRTGRFTVRAIAYTVSTGIASLYLLPHISTSTYIFFTGTHKNGLPVRVPDSLKDLVKETQDDISYTTIQRKALVTFMQNGLVVSTKGMMFSWRTNYVLGLPKIFLADTVNDLSVKDLQIGNKEIDWHSFEGKCLKESLCYSKGAKKFGIAEAMLSTHNFKQVHIAVAILTILSINIQTCAAFNQKYNMFARTIIHRIPIYALLTILHGSLGLFGIGIISRQSESFSFPKSCISESYAKFGLEYYKQNLRRNIALRKVDPSLSRAFQENGDETFLGRRMHLSIMERIQLIEDLHPSLKITEIEPYEYTG